MGDTVVLLDLEASVYAMRARIALAEKGIKYEAQEEDFLHNPKSSLLLEMNPVHKAVPVLIHNGKPICESLIIVQYIDEVWSQKSPLLPADPYQRSQARFWADYIDKKVSAPSIWRRKGEELEKGKNEFIEALKVLEGVLGNKPYFNGDAFGFVDIALVPFSSWFYALESIAKFSVEAETPKLTQWAKRCREKDSVSSSLADPQKVYDLVLELRQRMGLE